MTTQETPKVVTGYLHARISGGGVVHLINAYGRPVCGSGQSSHAHNFRSSRARQTTSEPVTCKKCLAPAHNPFPVDDLSRFIMYDAPIEIERAPESLIGKTVRVTKQGDLYQQEGVVSAFQPQLTHMPPYRVTIGMSTWCLERTSFEAIDTPAAPVIKQPLSDLEVLTASIRRIKRTLETTPPLPDQVGILIEIIDTAYAECLNALDTLGVRS